MRLPYSVGPIFATKRRGHLSQGMKFRALAAFTLVELLVVLVVVTLLASLVAPNVLRHVGDARVVTARTQIEMLVGAAEIFHLHVGRYPTSQEGLAALWERPLSVDESLWRGPYLRRALPSDPWGRPYLYETPGPGSFAFVVRSHGADGSPGGQGPDADIASW